MTYTYRDSEHSRFSDSYEIMNDLYHSLIHLQNDDDDDDDERVILKSIYFLYFK